jgi:anti-anti-sigma regulatory factor
LQKNIVAANSHIVVEFSEKSDFSSRVLGVMVYWHREALSRGTHLYIIDPTDKIQTLFKTLDVNCELKIFSSMNECSASLSKVV